MEKLKLVAEIPFAKLQQGDILFVDRKPTLFCKRFFVNNHKLDVVFVGCTLFRGTQSQVVFVPLNKFSYRISWLSKTSSWKVIMHERTYEGKHYEKAFLIQQF